MAKTKKYHEGNTFDRMSAANKERSHAWVGLVIGLGIVGFILFKVKPMLLKIYIPLVIVSIIIRFLYKNWGNILTTTTIAITNISTQGLFIGGISILFLLIIIFAPLWVLMIIVGLVATAAFLVYESKRFPLSETVRHYTSRLLLIAACFITVLIYNSTL